MAMMFYLTPEVAMAFFELCLEKGIDSEKDRTELLWRMAREGKVSSVVQTERTREQILDDLRKHYNILHIKDKEHE